MPGIKVNKAVNNWLVAINFFLDILSAKAPAKGETKVMGKAKVNVTAVSASGESSETLRTSQLLVIICIFMAINDMNDPIQIHLNSL